MTWLSHAWPQVLDLARIHALIALAAVDPGVRQAAQAVGHSRWSLCWRVDLPLATPIMVSGARVLSVSTVGLVTIGALVGIPSLGTLFTDGFQRGIVAEVVVGIVATVAIGLLLDGICVLVGRALTPWTRPEHAPQHVDVTAEARS